MPRLSSEHQRLDEDRRKVVDWRRWGAYVSERSWGTVREDDSPDGDAWSSLSHDLARSRAYRFGEDGIAGFCDRYQWLVLAFAFWNERDPILKERLFGLVPCESNHGEDVKECYFYLDATPTHSYLKYLYKYPQAEYPYEVLIRESRSRTRLDPEFEILDSGVFDDEKYFDIFIEYAKASAEDVAIRVTITNRGPATASLHLLPQLWFRNTWANDPHRGNVPRISAILDQERAVGLCADDSALPTQTNLLIPYRLGNRYFYGPRDGELLFTNNESNCERCFGKPNQSPYVKDAFHRHIINGEDCLNPDRYGTKAAIRIACREMAPGESRALLFRLTDKPHADPLADIERVVKKRQREADAFYATVHPEHATADERLVQRQALAGMIWTEQIYLFDVRSWKDDEFPFSNPPDARFQPRNRHWKHLNSMRIMSMPDKWEYPWFAAWDLAFHAIPLALVDLEFAKLQLKLLLLEQFQHANGQIPAYEWEFSDLNPPVHAWAVWRIFEISKRRDGIGDRAFLEECFHKLLLNFAWWVNRVDADGNNVFEGGFLGLDNITVVDRSEKLHSGLTLKQSDATGWMGMFCLNMMRIALELSTANPSYSGLATKFFEHFVYIGAAIQNMGNGKVELWSETDGFFYDVLQYPDGSFHRFRVRSLVGLIPLFAVEILDPEQLARFPEFTDNLKWFVRNRSQFSDPCVTVVGEQGRESYVLALVNQKQLTRVLDRVRDPGEFYGDFGLRSLSKTHHYQPFRYGDSEVSYAPAESRDYLKGGNSNWRGPIWFPANFLLIDSLLKFSKAYDRPQMIGSECSGSRSQDLHELAASFADRLISIFRRNANGNRPVFGSRALLQQHPNWRDYPLFFEYFHGDSGAGLGASHQTGWTGLVATLIDEWRRST